MNRREQGMTLIELMVSLAIGAFLMIGAITVFMQSRTTFRVTESVARLQETARFALEAMEPDIRMAHYWGLTSRTHLIRGRAAPTAAAGIGTHTCGNNWNLNLNQAVQGTNNAYTWMCGAFNAPVANSDTLVVRRASEDSFSAAQVAAGAGGSLYIQSLRGDLGEIFAGTAVPPGYNTVTSETHRLMVSGYYVNQPPAGGQPQLRRKSLQPDGSIRDEEILAGVEDMQIQFGIDVDVPGTPVAPNPNRGSIDRYVNTNDPLIEPFDPLSNVEILAVRVWLLLRGDRVENGLIDNTDYEYADRDFGVFNDGFRRVLVSKTIYLRNARPGS